MVVNHCIIINGSCVVDESRKLWCSMIGGRDDEVYEIQNRREGQELYFILQRDTMLLRK